MDVSEPTVAEIEAMAEKLWDALQSVVQPEAPVAWSVVIRYGTHLGREWEERAVNIFRAMARVALEGRGK